jgi:predicted nucleic acid-binding protein
VSYYFLDSSALIKRYILENGTRWVRSFTTSTIGNTIIVSPVTQVEVISGISRRKREGTITPRTAHAIRLLIDRHIQREYTVIELTSIISRRAEDLLEKHPLRAYDAIQLASALEGNDQLNRVRLTPLIFVSADTRLLSVAAAETLAVDDPNHHP